MSLLTKLDAFFTDHRLCADLDAGVDGAVVWIACRAGPAWRGGRTMMIAAPPVELDARGRRLSRRPVHLT